MQTAFEQIKNNPRLRPHHSAYLGGPLMRIIREAWDGDDQWGTTMEWWFAIAECMYREGYDIPDDWEYRPSPFIQQHEGPDEYDGDYASIMVWDLLSHAIITENDLRRTGNVLLRYAAQLKLAGLDY